MDILTEIPTSGNIINAFERILMNSQIYEKFQLNGYVYPGAAILVTNYRITIEDNNSLLLQFPFHLLSDCSIQKFGIVAKGLHMKGIDGSWISVKGVPDVEKLVQFVHQWYPRGSAVSKNLLEGQSFVNVGDFAKGYECFAKGYAVDGSSSFNAEICLSFMAFKAGENGKALMHALKATEIVPNSTLALRMLSGIHGSLHEYDKALEVLEKYIGLSGDCSKDVLAEKAEYSILANRYDKLIQAADVLIKEEPFDGAANAYYATACAVKGEKDQALEYYSKATRFSPASKSLFAMNLADAFISHGDIASARGILADALLTDSKNEDLSMILSRLGPTEDTSVLPTPEKVRKAEELFDKAYSLVKTGRHQEALPLVEEAIRLNPSKEIYLDLRKQIMKSAATYS